MSGVLQYEAPPQWVRYDKMAVADELTLAKAMVMSLTSIPFQRSWAEKLQAMELKREIAGTSKIEGADFTDRELDDALAEKPTKELLTRSQRQARAASTTYRWLGELSPDRAIDVNLIKEIHRRIVTNCDDDHCAPGELRGEFQNVVFGRPRHRGVEGGGECERTLSRLIDAVNHEFPAHDLLIQALAVHYHLGAMHPFQDGNGRTARAVEALMLRRGKMKDTLFIAMSNYYYDEKDQYLASLAEVRAKNYDLTPFLKFGLRGIATQCQRLLGEIRIHVEKSLFRELMGKMYGRLESTRKRALAKRELAILDKLLDRDEAIDYLEFYGPLFREYKDLKNPGEAYVRDLNHLTTLGAISIKQEGTRFFIAARLEWATEITETEFYKRVNQMPYAKTKLIVSA